MKRTAGRVLVLMAHLPLVSACASTQPAREARPRAPCARISVVDTVTSEPLTQATREAAVDASMPEGPWHRWLSEPPAALGTSYQILWEARLASRGGVMTGVEVRLTAIHDIADLEAVIAGAQAEVMQKMKSHPSGALPRPAPIPEKLLAANAALIRMGAQAPWDPGGTTKIRVYTPGAARPLDVTVEAVASRECDGSGGLLGRNGAP